MLRAKKKKVRDTKRDIGWTDRHDTRSRKTINQIDPAFLLNELAFTDTLCFIYNVLCNCINLVDGGDVVDYIFGIECSVSRTAT